MKEASEKLIALINELVDTGVKFTETIDKVWEQGIKEGFTREEIADIVRPIARAKGLNKYQVYYITHKPRLQEKSRQQYQELIANITEETESGNIPTIESEDKDESKWKGTHGELLKEVMGENLCIPDEKDQDYPKGGWWYHPSSGCRGIMVDNILIGFEKVTSTDMDCFYCIPEERTFSNFEDLYKHLLREHHEGHTPSEEIEIK